MKEQGERYPALEYFGRTISRPEFIENVHLWARVFKNMGVAPDEVVIVYAPFLPEICYITLALNLIGATSYFIKLAISEQDLIKETSKSRFAVVYDGMWENVKSVLSNDQFEKIIFVAVDSSMKCPMKQIAAFKNRIVKKSILSMGDKYIYSEQATKQYYDYDGEMRPQYKKGRIAFITSSSGTTVNGVVKGVMASNEACISQTYNYIADGRFENIEQGLKVLLNLPPTASTGLNGLFLQPLYFGCTCILEPRLSITDFYMHINKYKPEIVAGTGSFWVEFFKEAKKQKKKTNLEYLVMPLIGGEGLIPEELNEMNQLVKEYNSPVPMMFGYGLSEMFSVLTLHNENIKRKGEDGIVVSVGIPYPGVICGVFDEDGNELPYNQRGELWVKGNTMTMGYYLKDELTAKTIVDGWLRTGDLFSISEDGELYYYGRKTNSIQTTNNEGKIYLFDIENQLRNNDIIRNAMVNAFTLEDGNISLVAHVIPYNQKINETEIIKKLNAQMERFLPTGMRISGYKIHEVFRVSPTTAKIDRNSYMNETREYHQLHNDKLIEVNFEKSSVVGKYKILKSTNN